MSYSFKILGLSKLLWRILFLLICVYASGYGLEAQNNRSAKEMSADVTIVERFYHFPKGGILDCWYAHLSMYPWWYAHLSMYPWWYAHVSAYPCWYAHLFTYPCWYAHLFTYSCWYTHPSTYLCWYAHLSTYPCCWSSGTVHMSTFCLRWGFSLPCDSSP